jgi:hypothetical protein
MCARGFEHYSFAHCFAHRVLRGSIMKCFAIALLASACLAAPAFAAQPYSATLATALSAPKEVIVGSTIFDCAAATCTTTSKPEGVSSVNACHTLVQSVGALTAYGSAADPFSADKLKACNGG